jgi:nucleoside-diphosphate-sugar epimerase
VAELVGREFARAGWPLVVVCLRLGRLWSGDTAGDPDARSLSLEDAVQALRLGLAFRPEDALRGAGPEGWVVPRTAGWHVFHIPGGRRARFPLAGAAHRSFGYAPRHDFGAAGAPPEPRPARVDAQGRLIPEPGSAVPHPAPRAGAPTVTVFGASGPLAAAAAPLLASSYTLRLTDILSPEDGAARIAGRFPEAPRPERLGPPHAFRPVDITDPAAVLDAAQDAGALLNCTVVREQAPGAFRVNTVGAFNVLRAAVRLGIRRVVHTGPQILSPDHPTGYSVDFDVPDEVPVRAGANVYFLSKYLALELCRAFAENHGLEVAALLFSTFVNPQQPGRMQGAPGPDRLLDRRRAGPPPGPGGALSPFPVRGYAHPGRPPRREVQQPESPPDPGLGPPGFPAAPLADRALSNPNGPIHFGVPPGGRPHLEVV